MDWTEFEENRKKGDEKKNNPYVNWWNKTEGIRRKDLIDLSASRAEKLFKISLREFVASQRSTSETAGEEDTKYSPIGSTAPKGIPGFEGSKHPLNPRALNRTFKNRSGEPRRKKWIPDEIPATPPDKGTVIVGIIDEGISLSHDEFRRKDDPTKTRIISAWQQSAAWEGPDQETKRARNTSSTICQSFLPFGRELYQNDINELIAANSHAGNFDQDLFDRATGQLDTADTNGPRGLSGRVGHGTHVADLAVGGTDAPIMVTNLPNRDVIGLSGTFLEFFFYVAVLRMINIADALWTKGPGIDSHSDDEIQGYPIVFNLSFSKTAGARDAVAAIAKRLTEINQTRKRENWSRIYFSFPAGNDNLLEGVGTFDLAADGGTRSFELECLPEDQSPNFLEIWTSDFVNNNQLLARTGPLEISVTAPGQAEQSFQAAGPGTFSDLRARKQLLGRIYSTVFANEDVIDDAPFISQEAALRQRYILALRPTLDNGSEDPTVPSGRWRISLRNTSGAPLAVSVSVQSDQSVLPSGNSGRRPVLIDEADEAGRGQDPLRYRRFEDNGRIRDSYGYGPDETPNLDMPNDLNSPRYVFRHGSLSALATSLNYAANPTSVSDAQPQYIIVSTSHRKTDGRPAPYASTGDVASKLFINSNMAVPDISLPTEDGATVPGVLAAGARRGSKVALSGTSFAAALTTRMMVAVLEAAKESDKNAPNNSHCIDVLAKIKSTYEDERALSAVAVPKSGEKRLKSAIAGDDGRISSRVTYLNEEADQ